MSTPLIEKMSMDLNMLKLMFPQNAGTHNSIYRGENITNLWYDGTVSEDISNGTFANEFIGDYILGKSSGKRYYVADLNYWKNTGDIVTVTNHIVVIPETYLYKEQMNDSDTTTGGYLNSKMHTTNLETAKEIIIADFEEEHLLTHRNIFSSNVTSGYESEYKLVDSTIDLMNECMVFGSKINNNTNEQDRKIDNSQLAIFKYRHDLVRSTTEMGWWLRDVVSSSNFAHVNYYGYSLSVQATGEHGVRPVFAII